MITPFSKHYLSLDEIVMFPSNIGTLQIAQRLTGPEFYEGMRRYGITRKQELIYHMKKV